ncbi:MAG TPA: pilin [Patescibacteria group bacterium]|nr:pilin [Patescibacteria group bacterium]
MLALRPTHVVHAAVDVGLGFASATGLTTVDIRVLVGRIIRYFLGLLGIIAVVLVMYAGYLWMTAGGEAEKVDKAKKILTNAVIGLVIIVSAYAIVAFLFAAITGQLGGGGGPSGPNPHLTALFSGNRGQDALGNGIIDYHYPEPGQTDVPRNTKISITFKKPLVLSTVFKHYDDAGTFPTADDHLCAGDPPCPGDPLVSSLTNPVFELNTANIRLIPNESLSDAGSGSIDAQFDRRYCGEYPCQPSNDFVEATAKVTPVTVPIDPLQYQTLVFKPLEAIGSPSQDMNYRVALRGGDNGIKAWVAPAAGGDPEQTLAFGRTFSDGGYFWSFTTSTLLDTTPPKIVAVVPTMATDPLHAPSAVLDRNQLLQIYFNEAIDPTTASGFIGQIGNCTGGTEAGKRCTVNADCGGGGTCNITSGGFSNVDVQAQCQDHTYGTTCVFNGGAVGTVAGTLMLGNRYRTAEFTPAALCEGIAENSCGEQVYCLPKNVDLTVRALAATVGNPPPAAVIDNGVEDMVGNSLDGNEDGTAQGPKFPAQPGGRSLEYYRNNPSTDPAIVSSTSDTAYWAYQVGSNVDLVVPKITVLDPPPQSDTPPPAPNTLYADGPSNVPTTLSPSMTWSKTMSIGSMRTGGYVDSPGPARYVPSTSTLVLRSKECAKDSADPCPGPPKSQCACTNIDPPGFFVDAGLPIEDPLVPGHYVTRVSFVHPARPFYTANDLGYTEADIDMYKENIPLYVPIARAQMRDTKQNCFWPSVFKPAPASTDCSLGTGQYSCCDRKGSEDQDIFGPGHCTL